MKLKDAVSDYRAKFMTRARAQVREYFHVDDEETSQARVVELLDKDKFMCGEGVTGQVGTSL